MMITTTISRGIGETPLAGVPPCASFSRALYGHVPKAEDRRRARASSWELGRRPSLRSFETAPPGSAQRASPSPNRASRTCRTTCCTPAFRLKQKEENGNG